MKKKGLLAEENAENPFREGLDDVHIPDPATIVIFGVTGDLAARKLIPALYNLAADNLLPQPYTVVGVGRRDWTNEKLHQEMRENIKQFSRTGLNEDVWKGFSESLFYAQTQFDDLNGYVKLHDQLEKLDKERGTQGNRLFYLAIPPDLYSEVAELLGKANLQKSDGYTRIIIEKPFGHNLDSARELNRAIRAVYHEDQIYRIDHYLGKETVQHIAVFRFANAIF